MNSSCASVCYVASTHSVFDRLTTRTPTTARTSAASVLSEPPEAPPTDPALPATTTATTTTTDTTSHPPPDHHTGAAPAHPETSDREAQDRRRRHWDNTSYWQDSSSAYRGHYNPYREGRSRDHHREGSSGYYNSHRDSYRSSW